MATKSPRSSIPFAGTVGDSLELMKKVWGMAGLPSVPGATQAAQFVAGLPSALPSMITPTMDVAELDKRIADLRAVEQWLNLNMQMLRTTIQTLEVQRNTIATVKSMGGALLSPVRGSLAGGAPAIPPMPPIDPYAAPPPARHPARRKSPRPKPHPPTVTEAPLNPMAWWNTLQDQFSKVAAAAATAGEAEAKPKKPAKASRKRAAKGA
ncbi:MAG: PhaM family polyhydroxyalkanoate granule multifunctional regulatory protein [Betaproteobacteria bacterium]